MLQVKTKKRKLVKKAELPKIQIQLKKKKKTTAKTQKPIVPIPKKETPIESNSEYESGSDSSGSKTESEKIKKLLEPYTKDQLISFLVDAAINDDSLLDRIKGTADVDVSHRKIFVHGLGWDTTRETLTSALNQFGEIEDCNVVTDRVTGKAKGFAFVLFKSRHGAIKALKEPRKRIGNRIASCQLASLGPVATPQTAVQDTSQRKIYVSNVQADVDPERLRVFFAKFGEIETGPIGFDMQTGKSRGFALFVYRTQEGAKKVLEEPNKMFEGHQLHCRRATEGKNKESVSSITTALQPVQAPPMLAALAAAQNLALYNQQAAGLNPMYGGLFMNPNAGFLPAAAGSFNPFMAAGGFGPLGQAGVSLGSLGTEIGGYSGDSTSGSLGGNQSVLGSYGASAAPNPVLQGLQQAYPTSSQMGQTHGASAPFSGYSSYL